jgi:hypothetical protein
MPFHDAADLDRLIIAATDRRARTWRAPKPIVEVKPNETGYVVMECGFPVMQFTGLSARAEAWEYAETLLDDLRYEFRA